MIDQFEIERLIIDDVRPHIIFSWLILRELDILLDVIKVITEKLFYSYDDVFTFYNENLTNIICMNLVNLYVHQFMNKTQPLYLDIGLTTDDIKYISNVFISVRNRTTGNNEMLLDIDEKYNIKNIYLSKKE